MIEINLLPGTGKKTKGRGSSVSLSGVATGALSKIKDPWLVGTVAWLLLCGAGIGMAYIYQNHRAVEVDAQLQKQVQDSIRLSSVIKEKRKSESQRDSVLHQVALIESFDNKRYVWPHLMDEVSRALPPYTWVTSMVQTNIIVAPSGNAPPSDKDKKGKGEDADSTTIPKVQFRMVGNTIDIQALTRFMKLLEASPFIENVQLVKSSVVLAEGKEVTEFQLDASYQVPDPSAIRRVPVAVVVR
jgi:Tfp pilus assembly protein PilN